MMPDDSGGRRRGTRHFHTLSRWLYDSFRFVARHLHGFVAPLLAVIGVGLAVAVLASFGFGLMGDVMLEGATQRLDESVLRWLEARRAPLLTEVMLEITSLGSTAPVLILVLVTALFLWVTRHRYSVAVLLIAVAGGTVLNLTLKNLYDRPRPLIVEAAAHVRTLSFPSGHAMTAFIVFGSVAYLVGRLESSRRLRLLTHGVAGALVLLIGISRIYLGVHYPSDVIAGFLAGLAWLAFVVTTMKALQYFSRRKPEVEMDERDLHAESDRTAVDNSPTAR